MKIDNKNGTLNKIDIMHESDLVITEYLFKGWIIACLRQVMAKYGSKYQIIIIGVSLSEPSPASRQCNGHVYDIKWMPYTVK